MRSFLFVASGFFLLSIVSGCSSTAELTSKWQQPAVDSSSDSQNLAYFEKEKVGIGITNDADNLKVTVKVIDDETQRRILRGGLTIWFDSTGNDKKIFGVHFPIGSASTAGPEPNHTRGSREAANETNDYSLYQAKLKNTLINLEIIGPGPLSKEQLPVMTSYSTRGIKVNLIDTLGTLTYELTVPIKASSARPLAIGSDNLKEIGVGVFTGDPRRSMSARPGNDGAPNGGYGMGGGGGMGGGMGGMGGGGRRGGGGGEGRPKSDQSTSPVELWVKVKIAGK
jgi:hypothetical protein